MKIEQKKWIKGEGWVSKSSSIISDQVTLVFAFGERMLINDPERFSEIKTMYPNANIVLASTSGNIQDTYVDDQSVVVTALAFECSDTKTVIHKTNFKEHADSFHAGEAIGAKFTPEGLRHVFVLSDGHLVNGSELVRGMIKMLPADVAITGGLAGDAARFEKTLVGANMPPEIGEIVGIGFYGNHIKFGYGSIGGWDPFGVERKVTRAKNNILYELDGKNALDLYKTYLGEEAKKLPGSALQFPLSIRKTLDSPALVRTILSVNETDKSMIFAGEVPEGWYAQLMKANFDRLIEGASQAANDSSSMMGTDSTELAILISCVGRRIVLDQRIEEEIESVKEVLGTNVVITGFYSYGEIAPTSEQANCELHNQTMTITTISENNNA